MMVSWAALKAIIDVKAIKIQGTLDTDNYYLQCVDGQLVFQCILPRSNPNSELLDFETNYLPTWNPAVVKRDSVTGREVMLMSAFALNTDYEVRATGYRGTATKNQTTNIDFAIGSEDRYINGLRLMLVNHAEADTIGLHVVDVDGVIPVPARAAFPDYPVLRKFGKDWNVDPNVSDQGVNTFTYSARLLAGTYVRVVYVSTGILANVTVKLNLLLHKKVA